MEHFGHLGGGRGDRHAAHRGVAQHGDAHDSKHAGGGRRRSLPRGLVGDDFRFRKQRVWARQLNIENEGTHLTNDGGDVWVLGYKTERGGTLVHTLRRRPHGNPRRLQLHDHGGQTRADVRERRLFGMVLFWRDLFQWRPVHDHHQGDASWRNKFTRQRKRQSPAVFRLLSQTMNQSHRQGCL